MLGTISRFDPIKNHSMILAAFKDIVARFPNARLLIVGDGPLNETLRTQCQTLQITEQVIFTGFIIEPQQYLSIMDIFYCPH